jgi:hypothetical protein
MSNKLAKANGVDVVLDTRTGARPSFHTSAGYRIRYRHLSPETLPRLAAAARTALAADKPAMATQRVEIGPGEFREVENPHDTAYQEALEAWEGRVEQDQGRRFLTLCEQYALIYTIDAEEVAALKAVHQAIGDPLDDLTDAQIFLWKIALPTPDDQMTLYSKLFGGLTEEAIQAQKASFLSQLQGALAAHSA